jgi:hypothetical protein
MVAAPFGGGVIGNTTGSGPVIGGSSPPPRATVALQSPRSAAWGLCTGNSVLGLFFPGRRGRPTRAALQLSGMLGASVHGMPALAKL